MSMNQYQKWAILMGIAVAACFANMAVIMFGLRHSIWPWAPVSGVLIVVAIVCGGSAYRE